MQIGRLCRPPFEFAFRHTLRNKKTPREICHFPGCFFDYVCVNYLTITLVALFAIFTI